MPEAAHLNSTKRAKSPAKSDEERRIARASAFGVMLLMAATRGLDGDAALVEPSRCPALAGGAAAHVEEAA